MWIVEIFTFSLNSKTDDYVKHIFWKHNQKAEHWATLPADGQRKTVVDRYSNSETWKAVKSFWDVSATDNGKSGCGVVIKAVDRDRWVTISKIAVPLKAGTATAAEVAGVCVLTDILDLVFKKSLCVQSINRCTDTVRVRTTAGCERHNHSGGWWAQWNTLHCLDGMKQVLSDAGCCR